MDDTAGVAVKYVDSKLKMAEVHKYWPLAKALNNRQRIGLGISGDINVRWRTELDLSSGKALDQKHRAATQWTGPERGRLVPRICGR